MVFRPHLWIIPPTFKKYWPPLHINILSHLKLFDKLHTFSVMTSGIYIYSISNGRIIFFLFPLSPLPILNFFTYNSIFFFCRKNQYWRSVSMLLLPGMATTREKLPWRILGRLSWVLHSPLSTNIRCSPGKKNFFYAFCFFHSNCFSTQTNVVHPLLLNFTFSFFPK